MGNEAIIHKTPGICNRETEVFRNFLPEEAVTWGGKKSSRETRERMIFGLKDPKVSKKGIPGKMYCFSRHFQEIKKKKPRRIYQI